MPVVSHEWGTSAADGLPRIRTGSVRGALADGPVFDALLCVYGCLGDYAHMNRGLRSAVGNVAISATGAVQATGTLLDGARSSDRAQ